MTRLHAAVCVTLLATGLLPAQAGEVRLTGVPERLVFPIAPGQNAVITAEVPADTRAVWLAATRESALRLTLARTGDRRFQLNLADDDVRRLLALHGAASGSFRIFAERAGGAVVESVPVRWAIESARPERPQVDVIEGGMRRPIDVDTVARRWLEPARVTRIEWRARRAQPVVARAGSAEWPLAVDAARDVTALDLTDEQRATWQAAGELELVAEGQRTVALRAIPVAVELGATWNRFTIKQRQSAFVPGTRNWLRVHLDDITGRQVLVTVRTADGQALYTRHSLGRGDELLIKLGEAEYSLAVHRLVNFLIGDDFAELSISQLGAAARSEIDELLERLKKAEGLTFVRNGRPHTSAEALAHLQHKLDVAGPRIRDAVDFIERIASHSSTTGMPYEVQLPGGKAMPAAKWWREQLAAVRAARKADGR